MTTLIVVATVSLILVRNVTIPASAPIPVIVLDITVVNWGATRATSTHLGVRSLVVAAMEYFKKTMKNVMGPS